MASAMDYAWTAGFLDGEGYFGITNKPGRQRPGIEAAQVAIREPLDRLALLLGGSVSQRVAREGRPLYRWCCNGGRAVRAAIPLILPYLVVKREQAEVVFAYAVTVKDRGSQGYTEEEQALRDQLACRVIELRRAA